MAIIKVDYGEIAGGGGRLKHVRQVASYNPVSGAHSETLDNPDHIYWILGSIIGGGMINLIIENCVLYVDKDVTGTYGRIPYSYDGTTFTTSTAGDTGSLTIQEFEKV